jgi:hypothetical protein
MKKTLILILTILTLFSCKKKQKIVEGYLIDERTGAHFNPFNNATVNLSSSNNGQYFDIGNCTVDGSGYYKIVVSNKTYTEGLIWLTTDGNSYYDTKINIKKSTSHNFIIPCYVQLNRVFLRQSSINFDSIVINVTNSLGTIRYRNLLLGTYNELYYLKIKGGENNYLKSDIYSNGLYAQRFDTINKDCRTVIKDTITY